MAVNEKKSHHEFGLDPKKACRTMGPYRAMVQHPRQSCGSVLNRLIHVHVDIFRAKVLPFVT